MKKIIKTLVVVFIGLFSLTGCVDNNTNINITDYNGIYKKNKNIMHIMAISDEQLNYYVIDELGNKNYGTLYYNSGTAKNDDFDEKITIKLKKQNIIMKTENISNFKGGTYKKISDLTIDEYYEDNYGKNEYYGNEYTGKYTNNDGTIYIYEPTKKYVSFIAKVNDYTTSCEINIEEEKELVCEMFDEKYTVKLDGDKLSYIVVTNDEDKNYQGIFNKDSNKLTKKEIINVFDPFYALEEE